MNPLVSLFYCLIARSHRKRGNRQTDGTLTYKPSTVTLAAHKHRGLTSVCNLMRVCVCNVVVMSPLHDERRHQSLFPGHPLTTHEPISWSNTNTYSGYIHYTYLSTKYITRTLVQSGTPLIRTPMGEQKLLRCCMYVYVQLLGLSSVVVSCKGLHQLQMMEALL